MLSHALSSNSRGIRPRCPSPAIPQIRGPAIPPDRRRQIPSHRHRHSRGIHPVAHRRACTKSAALLYHQTAEDRCFPTHPAAILEAFTRFLTARRAANQRPCDRSRPPGEMPPHPHRHWRGLHPGLVYVHVVANRIFLINSQLRKRLLNYSRFLIIEAVSEHSARS
jgi:hypothetical protein